MKGTRNSSSDASRFRFAREAALIALVAGLVCHFTALRDALDGLSYDILSITSSPRQPDNFLIVYVDEKSVGELKQPPENFDRKFYAQFIDRASAAGARLIVMDKLLREAGDPESDATLARSLRASGKVLLAADRALSPEPGVITSSVALPLPLFEEAALGWGVTVVRPEMGEGGILRRFPYGTAIVPSLPWQAAKALGAPIAKRLSHPPEG